MPDGSQGRLFHQGRLPIHQFHSAMPLVCLLHSWSRAEFLPPPPMTDAVTLASTQSCHPTTTDHARVALDQKQKSDNTKRWAKKNTESSHPPPTKVQYERASLERHRQVARTLISSDNWPDYSARIRQCCFWVDAVVINSGCLIIVVGNKGSVHGSSPLSWLLSQHLPLCFFAPSAWPKDDPVWYTLRLS